MSLRVPILWTVRGGDAWESVSDCREGTHLLFPTGWRHLSESCPPIPDISPSNKRHTKQQPRLKPLLPALNSRTGHPWAPSFQGPCLSPHRSLCSSRISLLNSPHGSAHSLCPHILPCPRSSSLPAKPDLSSSPAEVPLLWCSSSHTKASLTWEGEFSEPKLPLRSPWTRHSLPGN